ncbi:Ca2+-binding RTX toxin-like protein [Sphingomonas zeicaulis]|uniref:hypothetical protein n=1 Tax=Sphingomonas zeicaulis TaxID=1632740 RepID=UPI003D227DBF
MTHGWTGSQVTEDDANNSLVGNSSNEVPVGGLGDDILNGGAASHIVSYAIATERVALEAALSTA